RAARAADGPEWRGQSAEAAPRPPRRVTRAVPAELETVVLKAMAPEPEGRYATAQELADDLRRFLEGRPVLAARPALRTRAARWARRHRSAVAAAAAVAALALAGARVGRVPAPERAGEEEAGAAPAPDGARAGG